MTTPPTKSPGLICRVERLRNSIFENGKISSHVERCEACQRFLQKNSALQHALTGAARTGQTTASPFLEQKILRSLTPPASAQTRPTLWTPALLSGALATALAVVALIQQSPQQAPSGSVLTKTLQLQEEPALKLALWEILSPKTEELLSAAPLQNEAEAVYSEALSAVHFLAMNFLPTTPQGLSGRTDE